MNGHVLPFPIAVQAPARRFTIVIRTASGIDTYTRTGGRAMDHLIEAMDATPGESRISVRLLQPGPRE